MLGEIKPILTTLAMPSCSLMLGILVGLIWSVQRPRFGRAMALVCVLLLWLLATPTASVWLSRHALPQFEPAKAASLTTLGVQAIVVLGAGLETNLPDGVPQLRRSGLDRLRHAAELSRATGLPLAATGGRGWGSDPNENDEATVTARVAQQAFGLTIHWRESESRDTQENGIKTHELLEAVGIKRIALVTHSWHMPRALQAFKAAGFEVIPAPMGYPSSSANMLFKFLPTATALENSTNVLREVLAIMISKSR